MALDINKNYKLGIDASVLKEVSAQILKRAEAKNSQYNVNNSFGNVLKVTELGIDLYSGKVDLGTTRQIALNNSGLNIQLSDSAKQAIQFLNSQAAQNISKNVEGKISINLNETVESQPTKPVPAFNSIISSGTNKDKNGSSPFYQGEIFNQKDKKDKNHDEPNSIFG